jgi:ParB/RepB/Spo0J family partition protein
MKTGQIATELLHPNDWNPNRMDDEEFAEVVAEVRHLEGLPKPVVVRKNEDGYEIVDGEHAWRAAVEAGFDTVPCEVIEADDFESMRQTYKRNQHGKHAPVLQGRLFRRMMRERELSARKLAKEISVSEGTVRNSCLYAEAADLRNRYAPDRGPGATEAEISELTVARVRYYLNLPVILRDHWLNQHAQMDYFEKIPFYPGDYEQELAEIGEFVIRNGLEPKRRRFTGGFIKRVVSLAKFLRRFQKRGRPFFDRAGGFHEFLKPLFENGFPCDVLGDLQLIGDDDEEKVAIPAGEWQQIFRNIVEQVPDKKDRVNYIDMAVMTYYKEHGIVVDNEKHPAFLFWKARIKDAPEYIKESSLSVHDKAWLQDLPDVDKEELAKLLTAEEITEVKRDVIKRIEFRDEVLSGKSQIAQIAAAESGISMAEATRHMGKTTPKSVFLEMVHARLSEKSDKKRRELFNNRSLLEQVVVGGMSKVHTIRNGIVEGRPAIEAFAERLKAMEWPEFRMMCAFMIEGQCEDVSPEALWLEAVGGDECVDRDGDDAEESA